MPAIFLDNIFIKALRKFTKNHPQRAKSVKKSLRLFQVSPRHPSLHLEKLSGSNVWSIRVDQGDRLFFTWSSARDTAIFFSVGPHDAYKTIKK